jgi:hypothetical protein
MISFVPSLAVFAISLTTCAPIFGAGSLELSQLTQVFSSFHAQRLCQKIKINKNNWLSIFWRDIGFARELQAATVAVG